jgi:hypothetical protein
MERAEALRRLERHQPHRLLFVLRIVRCAGCRSRWPCVAYIDARSALLSPTRFDVLDALQQGRRPRRGDADR